MFVSIQSESLVVCEVDEDLVKKLRDFRFRKETNNAAIISELKMHHAQSLPYAYTLIQYIISHLVTVKIDKDKQLVILDEEHEVTTHLEWLHTAIGLCGLLVIVKFVFCT